MNRPLKFNTMRQIVLLIMTLLQMTVYAQSKIELVTNRTTNSMQIPTNIIYSHPNGDKGWYLRGLNTENDGTYDVRSYYGLRMSIKSDSHKQINIRCCMKRALTEDRHNLADSTSAVIQIPGGGWQNIVIPIETFDYNKGQEYFLKFIKEIAINVEYTDHSHGMIDLKDVCFVKAQTLSMETDVYSRPLDKKYEAEYRIKVTNTSVLPQSVSLSFKRNGWEGMRTEVTPSSLFLKQDEASFVTVKIKGSDYLPAGAHESATLQAVPLLNNGKIEEIELISVVPVCSPFIIHDAHGWADVKQKAVKYDWAKQELQEFIRVAEAYQIPEVRKGTMSDQGTEGLVRAYVESSLHQTAIAYYLTGNRTYGEKVAETLRRLTDPVMGYPRTQHLTFQGIPQEGGTMEGLLLAYDMIKESGLLSDEDCKNVEYTFRLFCENFIDMMGDGGISNWSVFNLGPAAECALMLHDMHLFNQLAYGPCGLIDHLRYGTMDDGWWYEMSLSYNVGCAMCYTTTALAARAFGIDWINQKFPSSLTRNVGLRPFEYENFQGMAFGKFGPLKQNTIEIKRMWDGILLFPDYRGVMFGMGDGHEQVLSGNQFELAYYVFRDPRYASVLKRSDKRSLIYGVPELPQDTLDLAGQSGYSDNAGIAVLRSQTKHRPQREQIQVALKYGTHGSYHGHFDRISLLSLMRYGRSFYNPETSWFGYGSYMYKWWIQPSMSHNMVVVDGKMQEPTSCDQLLFHSGDMMQVLAMATDARWSQPPYMGGYDQIERVKKGEAPYLPIMANHPVPGDIGHYSEPVHQRRLTVVTDDYVVLVDYLKGEDEHVFDNLLQLREAKPDLKLKLQSEDTQWNNDPLGSGQFITSVKNYSYSKGGLVRSVHHFAPKGKDGKNLGINNWETGGQNYFYNEPGDLYMDAHLLWPQQAEVRIGDYAEQWENDKKMEYCVKADDKELAKGVIGTWILGECKINVGLKGSKEFTIEVKTDRRNGKPLTLMLADAYLINNKGKRIPLSSLKPLTVNVSDLPQQGRDYLGGPIKIAGKLYHEALGVEPKDVKEVATLKCNLDGLAIVRLEGILGGDYFVGNEDQVRKTVGVRLHGNDARYMTLIEPFEKEPMVSSVKVLSDSEIEVVLKDGRKQHLYISNFYQKGVGIKVHLEEWKDGKKLREELAK